MGGLKYDRVAIEDYLAIEREDNRRYEYIDGELFGMAGGTGTHTRIASNLHSTIGNALYDKGTCEYMNTDAKVEIASSRRYVYPDGLIACPIAKESNTLTGAFTNPRVIFEVVSESSMEYDFVTKRKFYASVPTVREYVIASQTTASIIVHARENADDWFTVSDITGLESELFLRSIEVSISLSRIYHNVDFPKPKTDKKA